jgi:hypothetical protein
MAVAVVAALDGVVAIIILVVLLIRLLLEHQVAEV